MTDPFHRIWQRRARAGEFAAIPKSITFESAAGLAMMIDGYDVGGGGSGCRAILDQVLAINDDHAGPEASALDLWIALFFAHRTTRLDGFWPEGDELQQFDALALRLRSALLMLRAKQKAGIMSALEGDTYWKTQEDRRG